MSTRARNGNVAVAVAERVLDERMRVVCRFVTQSSIRRGARSTKI